MSALLYDFEFRLLVEYDHSPACRGVRDKYGVAMEPDEPESVEIIAVHIDHPACKAEVDFSQLSDADQQAIRESAMEHARDNEP